MGRLLDEIQTETRPNVATPKIARIVASMPRQDALDFITALNDATIGNTAIARVLQKNGYDINDKIISQYRLGNYKIDLADYVVDG